MSAPQKRFNRYVYAVDHAARHLVSQVQEDGYMSAAPNYWWYKPHWLRDSSWVGMSLFRYAAFSSDYDSEESRVALDSASKILHFNMRVLEHHMDSIKACTQIDVKSHDSLPSPPARVGHNYEALFRWSKIPVHLLKQSVLEIGRYGGPTYSAPANLIKGSLNAIRKSIPMHEDIEKALKYPIKYFYSIPSDQIKYHITGIKRYIYRPTAPEFFLVENHPPARIGRDYHLYKDRVIDDTKAVSIVEGVQEVGTGKLANLIQNDSVPLILLLIKEKAKRFGLSNAEKAFLRRNGMSLLRYLGRIYRAPTANAWEIRSNRQHAYDVGAVYAAFRAMEYFSDSKLVGFSRKDISEIENEWHRGGPASFLKLFIKNDILYATKIPGKKRPDCSVGVDSAELYLFSEFGLDEILGENIVRATMEEMDKELFAGNILPIRFPHDEYFKGGRWLLLGLGFADYFARCGDQKRAKKIIDYVLDKYGGSYPEQELVHPESPNSADVWYSRNGGRLIEDLAWSYAALIMASISLMKSYEHDGREMHMVAATKNNF